MSTVRRLAASFAALLWIACRASSGDPANDGRQLEPPLRGIVLISIDALRADALGLYGSARPTSPFLDSLAERSLIFDNAFCQIPSTLPSHMSLFTGLYPSEHAVFPPSEVLSSAIPTLPELFRAAGYRTFGHSEAGWMIGDRGFSRGFDEWSETPRTADEDLERTFARGLASLNDLREGDRFFLFLHTYSVHDPYEPPPSYRQRFWQGPAPAGAFEATGPNFAAFNAGRIDAPPEAAVYYRALYEAGVRYMDDVLAGFFSELQRRGLDRETIVILTADHGEEFLDHGRYVHTQLYPETLRVPLVVVDPRLARGRRVARVVELVDLLPTLAALGAAPAPESISGESFADLWSGGDARLADHARAQDDILGIESRTLVTPVAGRLHQLITSHPVTERDGFWVARELSFDAQPPAIDFRTVAFRRPRRVSVTIDDEPAGEIVLGTDWESHRIELPVGRKRVVTLRAPGCESPLDLGLGSDPRCLAFKLGGIPLPRVELFDLTADPHGMDDFSPRRPDLVRVLAHELRKYPEAPLAATGAADLTDDQIRQLKALGYLQ